MTIEQAEFLEFVHVVVGGTVDDAARRLALAPGLATCAAATGVPRANAREFFFPEIAHYLVEGDTALHMAAATFRRPLAELLIRFGADCRARNRRGAEPLHYAADANTWKPDAQVEVIEYLLSVGADPNALNSDGVSPLHRAVRTRSAPAVETLLDGGASATAPNRSGSTPLHLAVQNTGRSGSGSEHSQLQQEKIIRLLLARGAELQARDGRGTTVLDAARSEWIREILSRA